MSQFDPAPWIGPVATKLFGSPNRSLSTRSQLRFGSRGSLAVEIAGPKVGTWYDHERGEGGGTLDLLRREKGLPPAEGIKWIAANFGAVVPLARAPDIEPQARGKIVATYDYRDADGRLAFQVVRYEPKDFRQRRPDGAGGWIWNLTGVEPIPYRLPQLLDSARRPETAVFIVEGEKDADTLVAHGLIATCNPGGAGTTSKAGRPFKSKWPASFAQYFAGRDVVILPDNDAVGQAHADAIAAALTGTAARIRIVNLPGLGPKGDVSAWMDAGGALEQLVELVIQTPDFGSKPHNHPTPKNESQIWLEVGSDVEIARLVTADLQQQFGEIVCCEAAPWRYDQTHWTSIPEEELWQAAFRYDGALFTAPDGKIKAIQLGKGRLNSILACMRPALTRHDFFSNAAAGINCAAGFIRFDDNGHPSLERHSPEHRCRHVLPGHWPKPATDELEQQSLLERLFGGCFAGDRDRKAKEDLLAEVAGLAALGRATGIANPKALVLKGESAENGKSQVLDLLRSLLPQSAVSSISPSKFQDRTFVCHLAGKLLNAPDELASGDAIASEVFKQVITGEPVSARDVYKSAIEFRPVAQHVFATNILPSFKGGMDRGIRRRLMVLPFNRVIPAEQRIEHIGQRIGAEEADLLLAWAVQGASRIIAHKRFTEPSSSIEALREWMLSSDPVLSWLDSDEVEFTKNAWVPQVSTKIAYANFRRWATEEGYGAEKLPAINGFSQRVIAGAGDKGVTKRRTAAGAFFIGLASAGCKIRER